MTFKLMTPNKRRSYGYIDRNKNQPTPPSIPQKPKPEPFKKNKYLKSASTKKINWGRILIFPFKLLWLLLKLISGLLWNLWQRRPHFKQKTKQELKRKLIWGGITAFVLILLGGTIMVAWANKDLPDPNKLTDRNVAQSTKIYDKTGEHLLYEIFADKKRTIVELDQIPEYLIKGVVATEDNTFYEHRGVILKSFVRAIVYKLIGRSDRVGGTSTLTQQLVKNAILTNERSLTRKLKEIILSIRLEQKYTKDQILKIYFNEIPYGSTNYGAQAAAQSYFGKNVSELNLQECATLAGLPKAPSYYLNDSSALKNRRDFVLERMFEEGYISREEADKAQAEELTMEKHYGDIKAPHFVLYVKQKLVEEYGEQLVDTGGLKVITSLDWDMQQAAEKAIEEQSEKNFEVASANNAALVALDPKTGQILAMVGSRNFEDEKIDGQFNVATLGKRQPGSSFKPIVYTAAFEKGYTPETVLFDVVTNFAASGRDYTPKNYDLQERGPVNMRQALQGSLNIPAVKTLYLVGEKKGVDFAERLGYSTLGQGNFGLSLVLGGGEVKLIEHVRAYSIFANGGTKFEPIGVLRIEDAEGDVLEEWKKSKGEKVLDEKYAALISNVLSDDGARAYAFGAGGVLTLPGRPVATKTGTTNNYVDAWTVGYTPSLVAGVWAGNTDNSPMTRGFGGSKVAAPIWNQFMREALKDKPVESFPAPPANDAEKPVLRGSQGGNITLKIDKVTGKLATSSTPEQYIVERTYIQPHSILHYVNKDDPRGAQPTNPTDDPQYSIWEAAIQSWITRKQEEDANWEVSFEEPPSEYDDVHSLELIPSLTVVYPAPSSTLVSRQINTDIRVSAPRGVSEVQYKIDNKFVGVVREHPFNLNYFARDLEPGTHTLTVIVEDDMDNRIEENVIFILMVADLAPNVFWSSGDQQLSQAGFPRTFSLDHRKLNQISSIIIYKQKQGGEKTQLTEISDFSNLFNNQVSFTWNETPEQGSWILSTELRLNNGDVVSGESVNIQIR